MKLKNRIIVGFMMVILVPLLLFAAALFGISETQHRNAANSESAQETSYDITISDTGSSQARIQIMTKDLFFTAFIILIFTGVSVGLWIYRSVAAPLVKLRKATQNIKEGNLDFVLDVEGTDEFSELCRDFEEMRRRLKESAEEKIAMDKENKELISNISHDLKTPITAVKGYVEGIMDGVADTPEKMDRYVRTIYNKTNEMDRSSCSAIGHPAVGLASHTFFSGLKTLQVSAIKRTPHMITPLQLLLDACTLSP